VVIADDQELVRSGLEMMIEARGCRVLGTAANGREAVQLARDLGPDVVLMDIRMPVMDGIAATRRIVAENLPARVLVLTTYDVDTMVYEALTAGAAGFQLKATHPDRLVDAIRIVAEGDAILAPSLTRRLIEEHVRRPAPHHGVPERLSGLTERELDVLRLIARGQSNGDIAAELHLSQATVKTHINRILTKLELTSRVQAAVLAYETGLVTPGE
jgi:DNA-binding NarL/FixJ family response regulator